MTLKPPCAAQATKWLNTTIVAPNEMRMAFRSRKELSESDLAEAEKAARIGAQRATMTRTGSWGPAPSPNGKVNR